MMIPAGTHIGPYEILARIGAGGMGEVYRARDARMDRDVAIKLLPSSLAANPDRLARFSQEARTAGGLNHPNVLVIFDTGAHEGSPYLVTELLEGETLRDRMARDRVPLRKVIEWTIQLADGVAAAHDRKIIHRDIKPENIFLTRDERVKLLDFGLAKLVEPEMARELDSATELRRTDPGVVLGTPGYMSPEQVRGETVDERSDIFSLGIVLAEMAAGSHPFQEATRVETMTAILHSDPRLPETLSPGLARIIDHMLAKRSAARFQSMRDVAFALQMLTGSGTSGESRSQSGLAIGRAVHDDNADFLGLTFRRGRIAGARFAPDGSTVYSAAWEGNPLEIFTSVRGMPDSRSIGIADADLLSISPSGELGVALGRRFIAGWASTGTLARVPPGGGAPRRIAENVVDADWAPDGKNFAITKHAESMFAIEYPIGRRLYTSGGWLSNVRFSRDGTRLAFLDHPWFGDDAGRPVIIDLEGHVIARAESMSSGTGGLAWSPDGDEVWFGGEREAFGRDIVALDLSGKSRVVLSGPGQISLCDVSQSGDLLITHDNWVREMYAARRGENAGRNLAWFNWPFLSAITADGTQLLFEEQRAMPTRSGSHFYVRSVDGGPAVHLGDGRARAISPDGMWIVASTGTDGVLEVIPTGVGESRLVSYEGLDSLIWWYWIPGGKRLVVMGAGPDKKRLSLCVPLDGGKATVAGPGNFGFPIAPEPTGERFIAPGQDERPAIYSFDSNESSPVPGTRPGEWPICWSSDGRFLFVVPRGQSALSIDRIDIESGERVEWQSIRPSDPAGIIDVSPVWITPDGEHYAYSYRRCLSELYLVTRRTKS